MKINTKDIENYERELTIEFDAEELAKSKKDAAKKLAQRVSIPGFRKGKVPVQILEQHVGKEALIDEAADILINKGANDAIKMFSLIPVTTMVPKVISCEEGKGLVYTLTFTPYPEVKLGEYKNLDVEKVVEPVTDKDVDDQLEHIRGHHAVMTDAAADDKVADGDFVTLDFSGTVNGEKFDGGTAEDYPLTIGSHSFIDNFEDQLIGLKVGEEKDVNVTFPENYHVKDLADKPAVFHCKINSIKHRELPELNDDFAKKASKFETLDEFKADLRKNLEEQAERRAERDQEEKIIDKAVENMTVDVPPVMIEDRITQMIQEFTLQLQNRGMDIDRYLASAGLDMDKLREDYREAATKNLLADILLEEVAKVENLKVSKDELDFEIQMMAMMYRTSPKQIEKILKENRQMSGVAANVLRRKAMQFIFDNRKGAEKVADEKAAETSDAEKNLPQKSDEE